MPDGRGRAAEAAYYGRSKKVGPRDWLRLHVNVVTGEFVPGDTSARRLRMVEEFVHYGSKGLKAPYRSLPEDDEGDESGGEGSTNSYPESANYKEVFLGYILPGVFPGEYLYAPPSACSHRCHRW